jgi:ketosteroid isomerase-like protein
MSQENVEILRRLAGFWRDRDYSAVEEVIHPDAVLDVTRNVFNPGVHRGIDGLRAFMRQTDEIWENFDVTPLEYIDAGDKVVVANRIAGTGRGSGAKTEMLLFAVVAFRNDKIRRYTGGFRTRAEALEAAGLSE